MDLFYAKAQSLAKTAIAEINALGLHLFAGGISIA